MGSQMTAVRQVDALPSVLGPGVANGSHAEAELISVVLPCLNEEASVGLVVHEALEAIHRAGLRGEVIVVDNGSADRSAEVASNAGARVIHEHRRGYGRALRTGIAEAAG